MGKVLISIAKAMKMKNRIAGRLAKVQSDIAAYNSVLATDAGQVDVAKLLKLRGRLSEALLAIKLNIFLSSQEVRRQIIRLGEAKSDLAFYQTINTRDGEVPRGYTEKNDIYVAYLKKPHIDEKVRALETEIDNLQDYLDTYNATNQFEVSEEVVALVEHSDLVY